jgi:hypothetical protein
MCYHPEMKEADPKEEAAALLAARGRLEALRVSLLNLHKVLVDSERVQYEQVIGRIQSPNHFLQLLTNDPWFGWLSPLSKLIVSIDEVLDAKEPFTSSILETHIKEASRLLVASETGVDFAKHYSDALQRDPDVVMAHAEATKHWRLRPPCPR